MVWSEIPVYWTILWENTETFENARAQLGENVTRDKNRASVILWTAANERHYEGENTQVDDPLGEYLDVLGCNEYLGWYDGPPEKADRMTWKVAQNKPLVMSEFGGDALFGLHGDKGARWTEEYQRDLYEHQLAMLRRVTALRGMSPWILTDFRSPRR